MPNTRALRSRLHLRYFLGMAASLIAANAIPGAEAQLIKFGKEDLVKYTVENPFERFPDGRPKVPEGLLERMKALCAEEVNQTLSGKGYVNQFDGKWQMLHPEKKLVGRAFTIQYMPSRPDLVTAAAAEAKAAGLPGAPRNQTALDMLQPNDVVVVDLFGSQAVFIGNKLAYYIMKTTGTGFVVDGNIYYLDPMTQYDMAGYFRGASPRPSGGTMVAGINVPIRIGDAIVMPGDVVFGDKSGIFFVPPQLVQQVVERAEATQARDEWTLKMFNTGKYKSSEIYSSPTDPALLKEREAFVKQRLAEKNK
jgi:4-hydroxy-4-methyl-2-oxoglutarate aldolase